MATTNPQNPEQNTHGIILRTSSSFFSRYAYFPLPRANPTSTSTIIDNLFTNSLSNAPHFPDITILDSVSSNILYQTYSSSPNFFHVYNLLNRSHFEFSFPHLLTIVTAAILIHDCSHFKVLIVCIKKHPNSFFAQEGDSSAKPLVFYLYSSTQKKWSPVTFEYTLTSDHLLPNKRKPTHIGEDMVCLDLTKRFLVLFAYFWERIEPERKPITTWEQELIDETTRYGECNGQLHCVKFNPIKERIEVHRYMEPQEKFWRLVVSEKNGSLRRKMVGIHPDDENVVLLRSMDNDEISMVNILQDFSWVVIAGKGPNCGPRCFLHGMNQVLEAAMLGEAASLQPSSCGILHPHENIEGEEGEVFIVSFHGTKLVLPP